MRLLWFLVLACLSLPSYAVVKVKIATDPWCPYVCEPHSDDPGILLEIAQQAFAEQGYFAEFVLLNWARAIKKSRQGQVQGLIGAYRSDSPDFIFGTEYLAMSQMCFYVRPDDNWQYKDLSSLNDRVVSLINGYSYGELFDAYVLQQQAMGSDTMVKAYGKETLEQRIALLNNNKLNTLIEDKRVISWANQKLAKDKQLKLSGCLPPDKLYIAFSPNSNLSPRLSRALDLGIKSLRQSGKLQQILNKYHND